MPVPFVLSTFKVPSVVFYILLWLSNSAIVISRCSMYLDVPTVKSFHLVNPINVYELRRLYCYGKRLTLPLLPLFGSPVLGSEGRLTKQLVTV